MTQRSTRLIANFDGQGYASGWRMSVRNCFRDALDIKWTKRKVRGKVVYGWTQGHSYSFKEGDMVYDAGEVCGMEWAQVCGMEWAQAMQLISIAMQVNAATPSITEKNQTPGWVRFEVLIPDENRIKLTRDGVFDCSQAEFVNILKTGRGKLLNGDEFDVTKRYNLSVHRKQKTPKQHHLF